MSGCCRSDFRTAWTLPTLARPTSDQICGRRSQNRLRRCLCFHFLLQEPRRLFLQTNIQRSVAHQMAMPTGASERLEQHVPRRLGLSFRLSRALGPQTSQLLDRSFQLVASQVNRQERKNQMEAVRITPKQNKIVIVA